MHALRILLCLLALADGLWADDATTAAAELPKPVSEAVLKEYPKAVIISAEKKGGTSETIYAVKFKVLETVRTVEVTSDGMVKKTSEPEK